MRAVLALFALGLLAGCTSAPAADQTPPGQEPAGRKPAAEAEVGSYVALGDSFTAAPFVPVTDVAGGCLRSDHNYPALVAARLSATAFEDVSCSGATTRDLGAPQRLPGDTTVPAQLRAVHRRTELVTVGIGGNDADLFLTMVQRCGALSTGGAAGRPCLDALAAEGTDLEELIRRIGGNVSDTLHRVRRRAPDALVVLVGYPRLAASDEGCAKLPLAAGDRAAVAGLERRLADTLSSAARSSGAEFVDMYAASAGHEVCSARPWVNGRRTDRERALAFHPFQAEQRAVAARVVRLWRHHR